jgi:HSP20 family molecular chaperone IbpA
MKLKSANLIVGLVCLVIGGASVYLFQNYTLRPKYALKEQVASPKPMDPLFDRFFNDDFFGRSGDPFKEMQRMREGMLKQFNQEEGGGLFDSWYQKKFGGGKAADISQREDDKYLYYDISVEGLKPEKVKVKVENGQLSISGQVENKSEQAGSSSYFVSSFHRSVPVPPNVDPSKVQIDQEKDKLVVKFPKVGSKTTSSTQSEHGNSGDRPDSLLSFF